MQQPRAPSSPPLPRHDHHPQEPTMYRSSSSPAPSPARPEGEAAIEAGHPADNDVRAIRPPRYIAEDILSVPLKQVAA